MTDTLRLQSDLDDAKNELDAIRAEGAAALREINGIISAFAAKHLTYGTGASALDAVKDAFDDLIDDATGPVSRRIVRLEDELGAVEDKDLRRNAPIVL